MKILASLRHKTSAFFKSEEGASGIEYAIIAGLVVVALSAFVTPISTAVSGIFASVQSSVEKANTGTDDE